ncbi:MAG: ribbon-helix-helix domain-containing protein [Coriobacteriales bacterium]|jgi:hypothetical protein|nr:ribbon-helix-helix domain-containing protein [Coriobacteriales bacterium]
MSKGNELSREALNKKFGVTEQMLDEMAEEYENGTWSGPVGKIVMGRPSIANEEVRPITFRLPLAKIKALDDRASQLGGTRSEALREAVNEYLAHA